MTEASFGDSRSKLAKHDHAVYVYNDLDEMLTPLERFLREGFEAGDLSAFVHSFKQREDARAFLGRRIAGVASHEKNGALATAPYREAFERDGHIDHDHAVGVVSMLQGSARENGRKGTRIFVDASKNYFDAGRVDEWFEFESFLGPRLAVDVGLVCAYRASDLKRPDVLRRVLATHAYRFDAS